MLFEPSSSPASCDSSISTICWNSDFAVMIVGRIEGRRSRVPLSCSINTSSTP